MIKCKQCCFALEIFLFEFVLFKSLQSTSLNIRALITSNGMNLALINVRIYGLKQGQQFGFRYYLQSCFLQYFGLFLLLLNVPSLICSLKIFWGSFHYVPNFTNTYIIQIVHFYCYYRSIRTLCLYALLRRSLF